MHFFRKDKIAVSATLAENFLHDFVNGLIFHPLHTVQKAYLQNRRLFEGEFWHVKPKLLLLIFNLYSIKSTFSCSFDA